MILWRRRGYMFGYGADQESDMLKAIIGHEPKLVGPAVLEDYQLCIQDLNDIPQKSLHVRDLLQKAWGDDFRSYTIRPQKGARVHGRLYRLSIHDRHAVDRWELVYAHWYDRKHLKVALSKNGKKYRAETQVIGKGQSVSEVVKDAKYHPWLMPKADFIRIAKEDRKRNS